MTKKIYDYPNHETYSLALHLDNDESLYCLTKDFRESSRDWIELSDKLKAYFKDLQDECLNNPSKELVSFFFDIGSFCDVDFDYLAKREF